VQGQLPKRNREEDKSKGETRNTEDGGLAHGAAIFETKGVSRVDLRG